MRNVEKFTKQLPSRDRLKLSEYSQTHDLLWEWLYLNNQATLLGQCLKARFGGGGGDPALKYHEAGRIDDLEYTVLWGLVDCYQAVFNLIQMAWKDIRDETMFYKDPCLESECHLFFEVLREHYDLRLEKCKAGFEFTPSNCEKLSTLYRSEILPQLRFAKSIPDTVQIDSREYQKAGIKHLPQAQFWLPLILGICRKQQKYNDRILSFYTEVEKLLDIYKKAIHRDRHSAAPNKILAVKWDRGQRYLGVKGGYKPQLTVLNKVFPELFSGVS